MSMTMMRWVMTGFVVGMLASAGSSCGGQPPCNATTCTGCCDGTGKCQLGNSNTACGARAQACTSCGLGQTCMFGGTCSSNTGTGGGATGVGGGFTTT
ncbi:MAG: hypothetical protein ABTQ32_23175, partial [Myxococcaceae bacterium]